MADRRALMLLGGTLLALVILLAVVLSSVFTNALAALEEAQALREVGRVADYLSGEAAELRLLSRAWAAHDGWADSLANAEDENAGAPAGLDTGGDLSADIVLAVAADGRVAYSGGGGSDNRAAPGLERELASEPLLTRPEAEGIAGLMVVEGVPMLVASQPLATDAGGALIMARALDAAELERLSGLFGMPVLIQHVEIAASDADNAARNALSPETPRVTRIVDGESLAAYHLLNDIRGQPTLVARVMMPRTLTLRARDATLTTVIVMGVASAIAALVALPALRRQILSPVREIGQALHMIGAEGDLSRRLELPEEAILADLVTSANLTLDVFERAARQQQAESERPTPDRGNDLAHAPSLLTAILDSMNEGVLFGTDERTEYANTMLTNMTGYDESEVIGQPFSFFFGVEAPVETRRFLRSREGPTGRWVQRGEGKLHCKDGSQIDVTYSITPMDNDPENGRKLYIIRDVTEEKALQARRDRFLAHASHELRTPLTNLTTRLYLLRRQPEQLETHLDVLDSVAAHMKSLVDDLLDISRFKKGTLPLKRERNNLQSIIDEVMLLQKDEAAKKGIELTAKLTKTPIDAYVDRKRFFQVITNLVVNAINYTPRGGEVSVELRAEARGETKEAVIEVRDSGVGIEEAHLNQIFQPFYRVGQQDVSGTGLGLAIVQGIVQQHGGHVSAQSRPGEGSTFTVRIAALPPEPGDEKDEKAESADRAE